MSCGEQIFFLQAPSGILIPANADCTKSCSHLKGKTLKQSVRLLDPGVDIVIFKSAGISHACADLVLTNPLAICVPCLIAQRVTLKIR